MGEAAHTSWSLQVPLLHSFFEQQQCCMGRIQAYSVVQTQVHFFDNAWICKAKASVEFKLGHGADEVCKKGW